MRGQARFELVLHSFRNPSLAYQPPLLRGWVSSLHREGLEQGDRLEVWSFCIPGYEPCREGFGERLEFVGFRVPADRRTVRLESEGLMQNVSQFVDDHLGINGAWQDHGGAPAGFG